LCTYTFKIAPEKIKYPGIKVTKEVKNLCSENSKKKINQGNSRGFKEMERYFMLLG